MAEMNNEGNDAAQDGAKVHQQPETNPDFIYLEVQDQPSLSVPITDQMLQKPVSPIPSVVPQNETTDSFPQATHASAALRQGYVPEQQPPPYNELYVKEQPGFNPGPHTHQPQPWNQQFQPQYQGHQAVTTQPQPMPSNVVVVTSVPQRNTSQGLAITSLVMAIIGIFFCFFTICCSIPGIVFAAMSLGNSNDPDKAKNHAKISITCTVIAWISGISILVIFFFSVIFI